MKKKKSKKGKPYHLTLNIEGEPVVVEVKKFSDWLKNRDKNLKQERKRADDEAFNKLKSAESIYDPRELLNDIQDEDKFLFCWQW